MDTNIQRALNDKLYDKRKVGALEYGTGPAQLLMHCSHIYVAYSRYIL